MANRRTTIELTDLTQPILESLELAGFDVRAIFNGAIVAFNSLSGDEQKQAIAEANGVISDKIPASVSS